MGDKSLPDRLRECSSIGVTHPHFGGIADTCIEAAKRVEELERDITRMASKVQLARLRSEATEEDLATERKRAEELERDAPEPYKENVSWSATYLVRSAKDADDAMASMRRAFKKNPDSRFIVTVEKERSDVR
jgi:hypothetical protein